MQLIQFAQLFCYLMQLFNKLNILLLFLFLKNVSVL